MKKILFLCLVSLYSFGQSQLELPYSIKVLNPKPLDGYYFNTGFTPYSSTAQVIAQVSASVRYIGQTFNVSGVEYWFSNGIADVNLVIKGRNDFWPLSGSAQITSDVDISSNGSGVYGVHFGNSLLLKDFAISARNGSSNPITSTFIMQDGWGLATNNSTTTQVTNVTANPEGYTVSIEDGAQNPDETTYTTTFALIPTYLGGTVFTDTNPATHGIMYANNYTLDNLSLTPKIYVDGLFSSAVSTSRSISTTAPLTGGGNLSADRTISIPMATNSADGYLSSTDWSTFNSKASTSYVDTHTWALTGTSTLTGATTIAGSSSNTLKYTFNGLGTIQTNGAGGWYANTTVASAGAQQISPSIVWEGQGWKTASTAASRSVRFKAWATPVQGVSNPTGTWDLYSEINNSGTNTKLLTVSSVGILTPASTISMGANNIDFINGFLTFANGTHIAGDGITVNNVPFNIFTNSDDNAGINIQASNSAGSSTSIGMGIATYISPITSGAMDIVPIPASGASSTASAITFNNLSTSMGVAFFDNTDTWAIRLKATADVLDIGDLVIEDNRVVKKGLRNAASGYETDALSLTTKGYVDTQVSTKISSTRTISTTSPLTGGGDLSADRTFAINNAAADGSTKGAASFTAADFNASTGNISIDYTNGQAATGSVKGFLTSSDWTTFNNKVSSSLTISTTSPLSGGGDLSTNRTLSIADAVADGSTKGAATFTASDFNSSSGNISIDYTNGQAASGSVKGFLTSTDWTTFNNKVGTETDPVFGAHTAHNITNGTGFLKNNGSGTWSYDNSTYVTASSSTTFTNKSGNISQWTNDSGYITASSSNTLTNKSGNISQWTNDSGYITAANVYTGSHVSAIDATCSTSDPLSPCSGTSVKTFTAYGFTFYSSFDGDEYKLWIGGSGSHLLTVMGQHTLNTNFQTQTTQNIATPYLIVDTPSATTIFTLSIDTSYTLVINTRSYDSNTTGDVNVK